MVSRLSQLLFPHPARGFPMRRWVKDIVRAVHIFAAGVLLGGHIFDQPAALLHPWGLAAVLSGAALLAIDLHASCAILFEIRGLVVMSKMALVGASLYWPEAAVALLSGTLFIGAISSHMPGQWRHRLYAYRARLQPDTRRG